ncbi:MAG: histidine kinase [Spirochaetae bacterium HGW-Spirochaetae-9]|nr:MAG: histidine kinase [Spirochaetae bacterium HGW-Spirochaetae-9]
MTRVKDILDRKGNAVISVSPDTPVIEALKIMADKNIGASLVLSPDGGVAGIFSERDFARRIILKGYDCETSKVGDMMTKKLIYVEPNTSIADCMSIMTDNHFRHLPVKGSGGLAGLVSIGDVVKALIEDQEKKISEQAFEIGQQERLSTSAI